MAAKTKKQAEDYLKENFSNYAITEFGEGWSDYVKIKNLETDIEFGLYSFSQFVYFLKKTPNRIFGATIEDLSDILKRNWSSKTINDIDKINKKREETNLEKYGVKFVSKVEKNKEKIKQTNLEKYGTENPSQNKEIKKKKKKTSLTNYGVDNPSKSKIIKDKKKKTLLKNYGVTNPSFSKEIQNKRTKTFIRKYGFDCSTKSDAVKQKIIKTKIEKGIIETYDGKTLVDIAKEKKVPYSTAANIKNNIGLKSFCNDYTISKTSIENKILSFIVDQNIKFHYNNTLTKDGKKYRYDFLLPDHNIIIECDGLYWHSDLKKYNNNYHKEKKDFYKSLGYDSLFFREDEIRDNFPIVKSIILNKIGKIANKIYARKCNIEKVDQITSKDFLNENHLMGNGSGRTYCLYFNNELVCCAQVKWKNKQEKTLEISRFCSKINHSVIGGWSKLINHVQKVERPNKIITFIDQRYGNGNYLSKMGWVNKTNNISFRWTNGGKTFHRMNFPSNTGYDKGLVKIWDCGQAKWEM